MNARKLLVVSVLTLLLTLPGCGQNTRSAGPADDDARAEAAVAYDRAYATGFFVGMNHFSDTTLAPVKFAVDDAVDLAWNFSLNPRINLLPPERVMLVLSGAAQKKESKERLDELERAGARVKRHAKPEDIAALLQEQAAKAGKEGLFVAAFATHGYSKDGVPYVLASSSIYGVPETALSAAKVFEIVEEAGAGRSLILVDACRERLKSSSRSGEADPEAAAALIEAMQPVEGQAVLFAAAAGKYAYDDPKQKNGVFSAAVLAGLNCGAEADARGFVTVNTLSLFVEKRVHDWLVVNRRNSSGSATQTNIDGGARDMPLVRCKAPQTTIAGVMAPLPTFRNPDHVTVDGTSVSVFSEDQTPLWKRDMDGPIARVDVVDLNGDGTNEVVVNTGQLTTFNGAGDVWWRSPADPRLGVTSFITADLFRNRKQEIVAIYAASDGSLGSRLAIFQPDGKSGGEYQYAGRLQSVAMGKETSHHWPRLVVSASDDVFMLKPNNLKKPLWSCLLVPQSQRINDTTITDYDNDANRDICITTSGGAKIHLNFEGVVLSAGDGANLVRQATNRR